MPTLVRLLTIVGLIVGLFYGTLFVLATYLEPQPRELTKTIKNVKLK